VQTSDKRNILLELKSKIDLLFIDLLSIYFFHVANKEMEMNLSISRFPNRPLESKKQSL